MLNHNLDTIYKLTADELNMNRARVKVVINDIFGSVRELLRNPEIPGILLHGLGTFEIQQLPLDYLIKYRVMTPEQKKNWKTLQSRVKEYHKTKKRNGKRKE